MPNKTISKENALKAIERMESRKINVLETINKANYLNTVFRWHMITPLDYDDQITDNHHSLITQYKFDLPELTEEEFQSYVKGRIRKGNGLFISLFRIFDVELDERDLEDIETNNSLDDQFFIFDDEYFDDDLFQEELEEYGEYEDEKAYFGIDSSLHDMVGQCPCKYGLDPYWGFDKSYGIVICEDENGYSIRFGHTVIDEGFNIGSQSIYFFDFIEEDEYPSTPRNLNNPVTQLMILLMEKMIVFEDLKEFEKLNTTTESIYDLGDFDVLIILKDGTNLTSWEDVEDTNEIIYLSEDLSNCTDLYNKYSGLKSLKAIIPYGVTDKVTNMAAMFEGCESLVDISYLSNWDTSNVTDMSAMFNNCISLSDISPLKDWNTSKVTDMSAVFYHCISLSNIAPVANWDVSSVESMNAMFRVCLSLTDASPLDKWNIREDAEGWGMLSQCPLEKIPKWYVVPKGDVGIFE